jgi:hypothetical protein
MQIWRSIGSCRRAISSGVLPIFTLLSHYQFSLIRWGSDSISGFDWSLLYNWKGCSVIKIFSTLFKILNHYYYYMDTFYSFSARFAGTFDSRTPLYSEQTLRVDTRNLRVSCIVYRVFLIHEITYTKFYKEIHENTRFLSNYTNTRKIFT